MTTRLRVRTRVPVEEVRTAIDRLVAQGYSERKLAQRLANISAPNVSAWHRWIARVRAGDCNRVELDKANLVRMEADMEEIIPPYRQRVWRISFLDRRQRCCRRFYTEPKAANAFADQCRKEGSLVQIVYSDAVWSEIDIGVLGRMTGHATRNTTGSTT